MGEGMRRSPAAMASRQISISARAWRSAGRLTATTVETVTFDRPRRVAFRLVRGPVPHVTEEFMLSEHDGGTELA